MERKLKILKGVLLLRKINRYYTKEKQIAMIDKGCSDKEIDEWLEFLKNPESASEEKPEPEIGPSQYELYGEDNRYTSCTAHDYSPSNPWDAPGMCKSDFI